MKNIIKILIIVITPMIIISLIILIEHFFFSNVPLMVSGELKFVDIHSTEIINGDNFECTIDYIPSIKRMTDLKSMKMICKHDLSDLNSLTNLEKLYLSFTSENVGFINTIPYFSSLKKLTISLPTREPVYLEKQTIEKNLHINELCIMGNADINLNNFSSLQSLTSLEILSDETCDNEVDITGIENLSLLEELIIDVYCLKGSYSLNNCSSLKRFFITIHNDNIDILNDFPELKQLEVLYIDNSTREVITLSDSSCYAQLKKLNYILLAHVNVEDISGLLKIPSLTQISIVGGSISDKHINDLENAGITVNIE